MRNYKSDAGAWLAKSGHAWGKGKPAPKGSKAKTSSGKSVRIKRARRSGDLVDRNDSVMDFVNRAKSAASTECIFVPGAMLGSPAKVVFCGKTISAARYMLLITSGAPEFEGFVARHVCGNGHLSCVNPRHLIWGTQGDNVADANKHRKAGSDTQDRINAIS